MAATIRLKRMGRKKQPYYRIVVAEDSRARTGPSVEMLGIYNPRTEPAVVRLDAARALYWLHEGAMPSDTVRSLFRRTGVWEKFRAGVTPETLEEAVVHVGPPGGEDKTTQRVSGAPRQPKAEAPAAPKAAPAAAVTVEEIEEPAAEAEEVEEPAAEAEEVEEVAAEAEGVEEVAAAAEGIEASSPQTEEAKAASEPVGEVEGAEAPAAEEAATEEAKVEAEAIESAEVPEPEAALEESDAGEEEQEEKE